LSVIIAFGKPYAVISEENPVEKHRDRKGKFIELSQNERGADFKRSVASESARATNSPSNVTNQNKKQGMVLPFVPISLSFDEISYAVDMPQVSSNSLYTCELFIKLSYSTLNSMQFWMCCYGCRI
jgi:hypothetical protein